MPRAVLAALLATLAACGGEGAAPSSSEGTDLPRRAASDPSPPPAAAVARPESATRRIVVLGDSLAAGYGLPEDRAFPGLLESDLRERGWDVEIVNAGVSGDTTAGGRSRLPWLLRQQPDLVVLELGANDALRGLPVDAAEENLREMIRLCLDAGSEVVLTGMRAPPNYGEDYSRAFAAIYPRLAEELDVALMPFLLEGVGGRAELNLGDGIHPNPEGHRIIADALLPYVESALAEDATPATGDGT